MFATVLDRIDLAGAVMTPPRHPALPARGGWWPRRAAGSDGSAGYGEPRAARTCGNASVTQPLTAVDDLAAASTAATAVINNDAGRHVTRRA